MIGRIIEAFPPNFARRQLPSIFAMALPIDQARAPEKSVNSVATEIVDLNNCAFESYTVGCPNYGDLNRSSFRIVQKIGTRTARNVRRGPGITRRPNRKKTWITRAIPSE